MRESRDKKKKCGRGKKKSVLGQTSQLIVRVVCIPGKPTHTKWGGSCSSSWSSDRDDDCGLEERLARERTPATNVV